MSRRVVVEIVEADGPGEMRRDFWRRLREVFERKALALPSRGEEWAEAFMVEPVEALPVVLVAAPDRPGALTGLLEFTRVAEVNLAAHLPSWNWHEAIVLADQQARSRPFVEPMITTRRAWAWIQKSFRDVPVQVTTPELPVARRTGARPRRAKVRRTG